MALRFAIHWKHHREAQCSNKEKSLYPYMKEIDCFYDVFHPENVYTGMDLQVSLHDYHQA